ncbi:MAG: hypothetical protein PVJ57_17100 [Phycisphaerae bacterium]|jgi:hypothetical protein
MSDYDERQWGGLPALGLLALATALAWLFTNPYLGFVIVFASGVAVLAAVDFLRRRSRPRS